MIRSANSQDPLGKKILSVEACPCGRYPFTFRCVYTVRSISSEQATVKEPTLCSSNSSSKFLLANLPQRGVNAKVTGLGHQRWRFVDHRRKRRHHYQHALSCRFGCRRLHPCIHPREELEPSGLCFCPHIVSVLVCLSRHRSSSSKQGNSNLSFPLVLCGLLPTFVVHVGTQRCLLRIARFV